MSIMDDIKENFSHLTDVFSPKNPDSEKEDFVKVPALDEFNRAMETLPPEEKFVEADGTIKFYLPLLQTDNPDSWFQELNKNGIVANERAGIAWNMCMTTSFTMALWTVIYRYKIDKLYHLTEFTIEKWYYQGLMKHLKKTPENDDRWQPRAHINFLNQILAENGRPDLRFRLADKVDLSKGRQIAAERKKAEIIRVIQTGNMYVFGGWNTKDGHIQGLINATEKGLKELDPYGNWKAGYPYQNRSAGPYDRSWPDILFLTGIILGDYKFPIADTRYFQPTWAAFCEEVKK